MERNGNPEWRSPAAWRALRRGLQAAFLSASVLALGGLLLLRGLQTLRTSPLPPAPWPLEGSAAAALGVVALLAGAGLIVAAAALAAERAWGWALAAVLLWAALGVVVAVRLLEGGVDGAALLLWLVALLSLVAPSTRARWLG